MAYFLFSSIRSAFGPPDLSPFQGEPLYWMFPRVETLGLQPPPGQKNVFRISILVLFSSIVTIIGRTAPAHDVDVRPMNNDIRTKHAS